MLFTFVWTALKTFKVAPDAPLVYSISVSTWFVYTPHYERYEISRLRRSLTSFKSRESCFTRAQITFIHFLCSTWAPLWPCKNNVPLQRTMISLTNVVRTTNRHPRIPKNS
ncbi:hypothetical protein M378DRAFT_292632 [Amanita muscaria Koide BX008]|uniref:Uncharacterized protein n=1 Tax=Amanita muscaria (strain Koide BX008) TaxID=946122 RepID=A0A0C2WBV0_AMAMK|nr:hypothetical protein M378DRAFT_292632 [Amanita muscaria Koide BX008]